MLAIGWEAKSFALASLDMSTGEFMTVSLANQSQLEDELRRLNPAEIVLTADLRILTVVEAAGEVLGCPITIWGEKQESLARAGQILLEHFGVSTLTPFGLTTSSEILARFGLRYVQETQRSVLSHIRVVRSYKLEEFLQIDGHIGRILN